MTVWLFIIFIVGLLLSFGPGFVAENNLTRPVGIIITLIAVGIGLRTENLRRKGTREKLSQRVQELENQASSGKNPEEEREKKAEG